MLIQSVVLRTQYITLTNLMAADDIRKTTWRPCDPAVDDVVMPEYMTTGSPDKKMANDVIGWLANPAEYLNNVAQLDALAREYAKPGATRRAAEYLLSNLGIATATTKAA